MPNLKLISATDTQYSAAVLRSMNDQRNHGLFCDVTIIIQDKKFRAHKTILSASSTYFHQLFSVAGQVIELNFIKAEIFEQILNYIYSSKIIRVRSDMLEELIGAGKILGVKFLANLGTLLSQVKGLPGLSKDPECKSGASAKVMPIITESFSISAEEFNQTCKSADGDSDDDGDSDNDDVMFVSETDSKKTEETPKAAVIDLDAGASPGAAASDDKREPQRTAGETSPPGAGDAAPSASKGSPQVVPLSRPNLSPNTSPSIPCPPARMSSGATPTTPTTPVSRLHSLTPVSPNAPQPCDGGGDMMGVHKKQVCCTTPQQGDFKLRLSDMSSGASFPPAAVVAKKTITLDTALEIDALSSSGCKVYANIGEDTYDIVPVKEDPDEGGSKAAAKGKRALMATPLKPFEEGAASPTGSPGKKRIKSEPEDHYELIMDGKTFYVCMVCKRPYVCLTSLRRHFNTHSWEKKYPCRYCNKVFALAEYRTKHEAHHTGERRYQCLLCNDMFLNYQVLSTHCKQSHNQDPSGRKEKDDTPNNLYRLLPYKSLPTQPSGWPAHEHEGGGGVRMIGEDGSVQHVMPGSGEMQSPTQQSKVLSWNDIFVDSDARSRPGMNPQQQQQQGNPEFDFVIPETY